MYFVTRNWKFLSPIEELVKSEDYETSWPRQNVKTALDLRLFPSLLRDVWAVAMVATKQNGY